MLKKIGKGILDALGVMVILAIIILVLKYVFLLLICDPEGKQGQKEQVSSPRYALEKSGAQI